MDEAVEVRQYALGTLQTAPEHHNSQASRKAVPSFASFQPKQSTLSQDEEQKKDSIQDAPHDDFRARSRRPRYRTRDREHRRHGSRHEDAMTQRTPSEKLIISPTKTKQHSDLFVVDGVGDLNNLTFGMLDQYATPTYSRIGAGRVVGSDPDHKIDRAVSNQKGLVLSTGEGKAHHGKYALREACHLSSRELRVRKEAISDAVHDRTADFLSLSSVFSAKRKSGEDGKSLSPSTSEDERMRYRSIRGNGTLMEEAKDPDLKYTSDASSKSRQQPGTDFFEGKLQRKRVELTRYVDSDPSNSEAWLRLIHHQESFLKPRSTDAERRSTSDIKISMYEKALEAVEALEGRHTLLMEMMEEATKVWDSEKVSARWRRVLQENPHSRRLWTTYLDFKQTAFSSFRYEEVQSVFLDCLRILQGFSTQRALVVLERNQTYVSQVFIMLRMTLYMRESGFIEYAVATWQAILEFEFFSPPALHAKSYQHGESGHEEKVSQFQQYWESEVPRLGEAGAAGWAEFCEKKNQSAETRNVEAVPINLHGDVFSSWITAERHNALTSGLPARTVDDFPENDPYRVVLFSDIKPFLIDSPSLDSRHVLLEAFLIFCQLPCYQKARKGRTWSRNGFLRNETLYTGAAALPLKHHSDSAQHEDTRGGQDAARRSPCDFLMSDYQLDSDTLYAERENWFSAFESWQKNKSPARSPINPDWVLSALKRLVSEIEEDELAEYTLALELCISPGTVKRTARDLLKKRTSSLRLYNAYALIEYRSGNASKGESALIAAINMSKSLSNDADSILLWRTWIWELMNEGKGSEAFIRLQAYGDPVVQPNVQQDPVELAPSPTKTLRTENALNAFQEHSLSLQSPNHAALAMACLILFTYLKDTSTLTAATKTFTASLDLLSLHPIDTTSSEEILHQSFARLLYHHVTHTHFFKPADIRSFLMQSIARFPQNTIFLSLYAWNETRFRIDDRVRSIVKDVVLGARTTDAKGEESVVSHFFAIHTELKRGIAFGSNASAVRASFERAVESKSGAPCAGLWKMYFLYEHSRGDLKKATGIFYRGIRACPWAKELYLLPFEYLREGTGAMREADLRGVYDLMIEKELRMHVDLEELIEEREG